MEARQDFDFIFLQEGTVANSSENQRCSLRYPFQKNTFFAHNYSNEDSVVKHKFLTIQFNLYFIIWTVKRVMRSIFGTCRRRWFTVVTGYLEAAPWPWPSPCSCIKSTTRQRSALWDSRGRLSVPTAASGSNWSSGTGWTLSCRKPTCATISLNLIMNCRASRLRKHQLIRRYRPLPAIL